MAKLNTETSDQKTLAYNIVSYVDLSFLFSFNFEENNKKKKLFVNDPSFISSIYKNHALNGTIGT